MITPLQPTDPDLLEKLRAIAAEDRAAVLAQIGRDWPADRIWSAASEWLILAMRFEETPNLDVAFAFGEATERLRWLVHRAPISAATPYQMAAERQKARRALAEDSDGGRRNENARRRATAQEWQSIAREVAAQAPKYETRGGRIEDRINKELIARGLEPRGASTIRNAIRGVRSSK